MDERGSGPRQPGPQVGLVSFDERTARAVVVVLRRAGIEAALSSSTGSDEVEVVVPESVRAHAMQVLGSRMEEVTQAAVEEDRRTRPAPEVAAAQADVDDVHAGPPLVMERLRSMRVLAAVVMVPLLVVTLAPTIRGDVRVVLAVALMAAAAIAVVVRRRR